MNLKYRTYKVKMYPNKKQIKLLEMNIKYSAILYNIIVNYERSTYKDYNAYLNKCKKDNVTPNFNTISMINKIPTLSKIKNMPKYKYLKDADSLALDSARLDVKNAYDLFFKGINSNRPLFKSTRKAKSYTTRCVKRNIRFDKNKIRLPKIGFVRVKNYIDFLPTYNIDKVTIKTDKAGKFYAFITYSYEENTTFKIKSEDKFNDIYNNSIGLDFNIENVYVADDGSKGKHNVKIQVLEERIHNLFLNLKGRKYGSIRWENTVCKIRKLYRKIANLRKNNINKMVNNIIRIKKYVFIETISIREMAKSVIVRGDLYDCGFYKLYKTIEYKLKDIAGKLVKIDKWYPSSKTCSICGNINNDLEKTERVYHCKKCKAILDRDINAAINIKREGILTLLANKKFSN